jgi:hypothetical protein
MTKGAVAQKEASVSAAVQAATVIQRGEEMPAKRTRLLLQRI